MAEPENGTEVRHLTVNEIASQSLQRAFQSGSAGASAMILEVAGLMWLRTTVNYQYRYGTPMRVALKTLYKQGGVPRFYRGVSAAIIQAPLSRFSDTASNTGVLTFMNSHPEYKHYSIGVKTLAASTSAALLRVIWMPIDTVKTTLQVEGKEGMVLLKQRVKQNPMRLYYGAVGAMVAKWTAHFPFFYVYNYLQTQFEMPDTLQEKLLRNAGIGFTASILSDSCANTFRVLKTYRQTHKDKISYLEGAQQIIKGHGVKGLLGRGLTTRIFSNGLQGVVFLVLWTYIDDKFFGGHSMKLKLDQMEEKFERKGGLQVIEKPAKFE